MKVRNFRLTEDSGKEVSFTKSPNVGGEIVPVLLVMHFTAGGSAEGSIAWLTDPKSEVSAHLVIGRDGSVTQLVPLNRKANHAGKSVWKGRQWCNGFSVGIELDNAGKLTRKRGKWVSDFGECYPDEEVLEAKHKDEDKVAGWHRYTPEQIRAARDAAVAIVRDLGIADIVGHEDISPHRKNDPGPAFPMEAFRKEVLAQAGLVMPDAGMLALDVTGEPEVRMATGVEYVVETATALRKNPSPRSRKVAKKPFPKGTIVRPLRQEWWLVEIVKPGRGKAVKGWMRISDLVRAPESESMSPLPSIDVTPAVVPATGDLAARRLKIAAQIVNFEARRDSKGRIMVYRLPSNDGGGTYEVAGINQRFHPDEAARLRDLIEAGKQDEAEKLADEYIASYTDVVAKWTTVGPIESYLRDSAFNRGPTGAAKILQIALGVKADGRIGPVTVEALRKAEEDPEKLLAALREARETYELRVSGRRPNLWKGLVNRWNGALDFSKNIA